MKQPVSFRMGVLASRFLVVAIVLLPTMGRGAHSQTLGNSTQKALEAITQELQKLEPTTANAADLVSRGRQIFRFDTFGDEAFWGDKLQLHLAIEGSKFAASAQVSAQRAHSPPA